MMPVATVGLRDLSKAFGEVPAVDRITLDVPAGELLALLGPSGCGKTTTLRMIAGFEKPTGGQILLGGRDVTTLPPEKRNCGMVFQNYALFPHLTVSENVAFGLEMRRVPKAERGKRVQAMLERVGLAALSSRYPRQLSGGQQQRTALARVLALNPAVLLLDEPLANLDAQLREEMRFYIHTLQQEYGITTVYVTHDQAEAMVLADQVAVLMEGKLQQLGPPQRVYQRPRNADVAKFIGLTNLFPGKLSTGGDEPALETDLGVLRAGGGEDIRPGSPALLSVRPESLRLRAGAAHSNNGNCLRGRVADRSFLGSLIDYRVALPGDRMLRVQANPSLTIPPGEEVLVEFDVADAWIVPEGHV